jgi:hypothetical protein
MAIDVEFVAPETPPSSTDAVNFRTRADTFVTFISSFVTKLIAFVTQLNNTEASINAKEANAVSAASAAVSAANYKGIFVQGTSSALVGESWSYDGVFYRCDVNTTDSPSVEPASWSATSFEFLIHSAASKATPIDADEFGFWDSVTGLLKKVSFANLFATLKARFDLLYMSLSLLINMSSGVRQTIQSGSVDTNGYPNFATAGTGRSINISALTNPIKIHAAGGHTNRLVKLLSDMTISGLAANALNYCYFDVASDGTITGGATVVPPEYINGVPDTAFPTWDSASKGSGIDLTNGNLTATRNGTAWANSTVYSSKTVKSGKVYAEITVGATSGGYIHIGLSANNTYQADAIGTNPVGYSYRNDANKVSAGSAAAYGATYTTGDVIGVMYDAPTGQITFYKNNVSQGVAFTVTPYTLMYLAVSHYATGNTSTTNYGSSAFTYSLPSGASAWNDEILNGKFTFSISEMKAYVGNSSAAPQSYRVFFAEAQCDASTVTSVVNYALNGKYRSGISAYATSQTTAYPHNIGTNIVKISPKVKCKTTNLGYAVGEIVDFPLSTQGGCTAASVDRNSVKLSTHSAALTITDRPTFGMSSVTVAYWEKFIEIERSF